MNAIQTYDAIIVGGGPAGSTCASILVGSGMHALLLDKVNFPRVKLCGGWLSPSAWDILGMSPNEYTPRLWKFKKVYIHFHGKKYTIKANGYFVRRYEFDDFLLQRSKVQTVAGYNMKQVKKDREGFWVIDNQFRAKYLIGAGGTNCPVARALFPKTDGHECGTRGKEFEGDPEEIAACRAGEDGEPEILLQDDMKGYSWNVPKANWLNVGTGTFIAGDVLPAWNKARAFFEGNGVAATIPVASRRALDEMKGHGYTLFNTDHLASCQSDNAFLVGDALGLAQPITGEGMLPAMLSGKLCATAIVEGTPETYRERLRSHPIIHGYRVMHSMQVRSKKFFKNRGNKHYRKSWLRDRITVKVFAMLFSGKRTAAIHLINKMIK